VGTLVSAIRRRQVPKKLSHDCTLIKNCIVRHLTVKHVCRIPGSGVQMSLNKYDPAVLADIRFLSRNAMWSASSHVTQPLDSHISRRIGAFVTI
jgi:hypothetical protein